MKKLFISITVLLAIFFPYKLMSRQQNPIKVGYCQTMSKYIALIESEHKKFLYESASEVLKALNNKEIDIALIGRKARPEEINNDIKSLQVFNDATTLIKEINNNTEPILIPWKEIDYNKQELVVLTYKNGEKIENHRSPFIYSLNTLESSLINQLILKIKGS